MTTKEFQHKYHNYCVQDVDEANYECEKVNKELEISSTGWAEVTYFPKLGYCLMLKIAKDAIKKMNII